MDDTTSQPPASPTLVPNRECGTCTACCFYFPIDAADFQKLPSTLCIHCVEKKGCGIHQTRPQTCRNYFCVWRLSNMFDDTWRPDRSGILMSFRTKDIPPGYVPEGIELLITNAKTALAKPGLFKFLVRAITNKVPIFICVPGPIGFNSAGVLLNPVLELPVAHDDNKAIKGLLEALVKRLESGPFERVELKHLESKTRV